MGRGIGSAAFTLIELLIVIALTVVLMTLLFGPLVAGFQYTSRAQTMSAATDGQRLLLRQVARDLTSAADLRDTTDKYLNAVMLQKTDPTAPTGTQALVHMYNAYTDVVAPLGACQDAASIASGTCNGKNITVDPTTDQAVILQTDTSGTSYGASPGIVTPIAPSTAFTRYFVALRFPYSPLSFAGKIASGVLETVSPEPYSNTYENALEQTNAPDVPIGGTVDYSTTDVAKQQLNNTYVLYVANASPYNKVTSSSTTATVNDGLFETDPATGKPVLDDPDFFRIVQKTDLLPPSNPNYAAGSCTTYNDVPNEYVTVNGTRTQVSATDAHNARVYNWYKISHMVLSGRDYDLLATARVGGGVDWGQPTTAVNPFTGAAYGYVAKSSNAANSPGFVYDSVNLVNNAQVLRIRPTFLISPGGVTGETVQAKASDDVSQGVQATGNSVQQMQYIPSVYSTAQQQLQGTPSFAISAGGTTFQTSAASIADISSAAALANGKSVVLNDMIEKQSGTVVYDITQRSPVTSATSYVACTFNASAGTLSFAVPALPPVTGTTTSNADPLNSYNTWWCAILQATDATGEMYLDLGDNTVFPGNPLASGISPPFTVVVNSERVRGPDRTSGPAKYVTTPTTAPITYPLVSYTRVPLGSPVGTNQYSIQYYNPTGTAPAGIANARLYFGTRTDWAGLLAMGGATMAAQNTILVSYNVQNNNTATPSALPTAGPSAATITASYASGNSMQIVAGMRVYDPVSKIAAFLTNSETVTVGNGTR